jgi:acyl-CoA hydrolase
LQAMRGARRAARVSQSERAVTMIISGKVLAVRRSAISVRSQVLEVVGPGGELIQFMVPSSYLLPQNFSVGQPVTVQLTHSPKG